MNLSRFSSFSIYLHYILTSNVIFGTLNVHILSLSIWTAVPLINSFLSFELIKFFIDTIFISLSQPYVYDSYVLINWPLSKLYEILLFLNTSIKLLGRNLNVINVVLGFLHSTNGNFDPHLNNLFVVTDKSLPLDFTFADTPSIEFNTPLMKHCLSSNTSTSSFVLKFIGGIAMVLSNTNAYGGFWPDGNTVSLDIFFIPNTFSFASGLPLYYILAAIHGLESNV